MLLLRKINLHAVWFFPWKISRRYCKYRCCACVCVCVVLGIFMYVLHHISCFWTTKCVFNLSQSELFGTANNMNIARLKSLLSRLNLMPTNSNLVDELHDFLTELRVKMINILFSFWSRNLNVKVYFLLSRAVHSWRSTWTSTIYTETSRRRTSAFLLCLAWALYSLHDCMHHDMTHLNTKNTSLHPTHIDIKYTLCVH